MTQVLIATARAHPTDVAVQLGVTGALRNLCLTDASADLVVTAGGLVESRRLWVHMSRTYIHPTVVELPMPGWPSEGRSGTRLPDQPRRHVITDYMGRGMTYQRHPDVQRMSALAKKRYDRVVG